MSKKLFWLLKLIVFDNIMCLQKQMLNANLQFLTSRYIKRNLWVHLIKYFLKTVRSDLSLFDSITIYGTEKKKVIKKTMKKI